MFLGRNEAIIAKLVIENKLQLFQTLQRYIYQFLAFLHRSHKCRDYFLMYILELLC